MHCLIIIANNHPIMCALFDDHFMIHDHLIDHLIDFLNDFLIDYLLII